MSWTSAAWWLCYAVAAIALQALMPGLDFFLPGFILALQERNFPQLLAVGALFVMLQEGMGSMAFGGMLLWYALAAIVFYVGCGLLQGTGFLFVTLFGMLLSCSHYVIFALLVTLQDIPWDPSLLFDECLFQALFTPWVWWLASALRRRVIHEDRNRQR